VSTSAPVPVQTVTHISVQLTGAVSAGGSDQMNQLLFTACSPPDWSIDAPVFTYHGNDGAPTTAIPGVMKPTYGTMTLSGGWDQAGTLASWMTLISDTSKTIDQKTCTVTVQFLDNTGAQVLQWVGNNALMTSFSHSASDASSNGVLMVNVSITAAEWVLTSGSGGGGGGGGGQ
jgi:hypothetical protein